ncbi:hypothetical protein [Streptomyces sp. HUAS TT7]|uniref:hypothetical protein n=1 Tax=Streptomyces sp. HUAS TT7 TaxID=3447507 RepID=UPI003F65EB54
MTVRQGGGPAGKPVGLVVPTTGRPGRLKQQSSAPQGVRQKVCGLKQIRACYRPAVARAVAARPWSPP